MFFSSVSQTATFLAIKFYGMTKYDRYRCLFDAPIVRFYENLVTFFPAPWRYYHYWLEFEWVRKLYILSEELFLPGDLLHVIARKWYINKLVQKCIDDGYQQLLVLGSGFDHLSLHYQQQGLNCVELDTPSMVAVKKRFLLEQYPDAQHPEMLPLELPADLEQAFKNVPQLSADVKTMIVAEGFFDYLQPDNVFDILQDLRNHFSQPRLISTHFALDELSAFHRSIYKSSVSIAGEQLAFKNGMDSFEQLLSEQSFHIHRKINASQLTRELSEKTGTSLSVLPGFYILEAY